MNLAHPIPGDDSGKLAENIMHFARVLRRAGLPVGPAMVIDALDAAAHGCVRERGDFYWMLHAVFVKRRQHRQIFDQAFHVFWRKPKMLEEMMQLLFQQIQLDGARAKPQAAARRIAEAMFEGAGGFERERPADIEVDAEFTASPDEVLRTMDFEQMSAAEEAVARQAIARLRLERFDVVTRRHRPAHAGARIDMRRTLKQSLRTGGGMIDMAWRTRRTRRPPLVVLCDISGSMSNYSRMFMHFVHALMGQWPLMHVFVFGTRLTNITRELKRKDVDEAMQAVAGAVEDWSGGTRIGETLRAFNYRWARRVLAQQAHVLFVSDGLERGDLSLLERESARLHRSAKRVIWLNPLLRYDGFEALAGGIRAIMAHVDEFRPVHSLDSLADLAEALAGGGETIASPASWLARSEP